MLQENGFWILARAKAVWSVFAVFCFVLFLNNEEGRVLFGAVWLEMRSVSCEHVVIIGTQMYQLCLVF